MDIDDDILYSEFDVPRVSNIFKYHLIIMKLVGEISWQSENYLPHKLRFVGIAFNHFYQGCMIIIPGHLAIFLFKSSYDSFISGELEPFCDSLAGGVIYGFATYANVFWLLKPKELTDYLEFVQKNHLHRTSIGLTFVNCSQSYRKTLKVTLIWLSINITGVCYWTFLPIVSGQGSLPFVCWYPYDPMKPGYYEFTYFIQMLGQLHTVGSFGFSSNIFLMFVIVLVGQYDILFCNLKNFSTRAKILAGVNISTLKKEQDTIDLDGDEVNQYLVSTEYKTDLDNLEMALRKFQRSTKCSESEFGKLLQYSIRKCIIHHLLIIKAATGMEQLFNSFCLIKSFQNLFQICFNAFVVIVSARSATRTLSIFNYMSLSLIELFLYTYTGEVLRQQSLRVGEAVMRSSWFSYTKYISKDLAILIENTKKPVVLTAGKFFTMDISRMRSVLGSAFSFMTLLQKLADKNGA